MTCRIGENVIICDGQSGWRVYPDLQCPWCLERRRCIGTAIFGGWCGFDYICGTCGTKWSTDDDRPISEVGKRISNEQREQNIARVAALADPKCWDCHDSGDTGMPGFDEPGAHPCACSVAREGK